MLNTNLATLVGALDATCRNALEQSAAGAVRRQSHEITIEDFLLQLAQTPVVRDILVQFDLNADDLIKSLNRLHGDGSPTSRPVFSTLLIELLQEAFLLNSLEFKRPEISVFILFLTILKKPAKYSIMPFYKVLGQINGHELARLMAGLDEEQGIGGKTNVSLPAKESSSYIQDYTTDFTEEARQGRIDPVFARGPHIRQMIDILSRRRKNNPILVGDPGVGKTAVVEGLARKIVEGNIPELLQGTRVVGLDMGRLQAGASVKGEFEKRLKGVIDEIKASPVPIILFIDEAHTLVGSGNEAGSGDGANLLKPALARGELRTIAATTWSEYKKYFEKDAALARRFQLVKLDQPTAEETVAILRGIVPHYEKEHKVYVRDDAIISIAELSTRYISGRQQPDKAIDLLDTACAKVKVSLKAKPASLEQLEEEESSLEREINALERDVCQNIVLVGQDGIAERHASLQGKLSQIRANIDRLKERWRKELALVDRIVSQHIKEQEAQQGEDKTQEAPSPAYQGKPSERPVGEPLKGHRETGMFPQTTIAASQGPHATTPPSLTNSAPGGEGADNGLGTNSTLKALRQELQELQNGEPLIFYEVEPQLVASIVAEWTGIPTGKIGADEVEKLTSLKQNLAKRIKGQRHALDALEQAVLAARTGLNNPNAPIAIFLLVGPSGVGKTETALAVADELYGGSEMLISINMSEFQEKHTISRLIGSPPGYVGYGEGGRLTEAVRRQPYSVVLFDEVEKAHPDVINLFYQIFDKGVLADGEGREVDFKNTVIFVTSNLAADITVALCEDHNAETIETTANEAHTVANNGIKAENGDNAEKGDKAEKAGETFAAAGSPTALETGTAQKTTGPDPEILLEAIRPALSQFFHPALLGRMTIIPYTSISPKIMMELVDLKLGRIAERLHDQHRVTLRWNPQVSRSIAASCTLTDTGARNIDHVINATLLPGISQYILAHLNKLAPVLQIGLHEESGSFTYTGGTA